MKALRVARAIALTAVVLVFGCVKRPESLLRPNQAPSVEVSPIHLPSADPSSYQYRVQWSGWDADGRVKHFIYAIDPPSLDRVDGSWLVTTDRDRVLSFPLSKRPGRGSSFEATARSEREPHVFAIRAVDDRGAQSDPGWAAFFPDNIPPSVIITLPRPSSLIIPVLGQSPRIEWQGVDPDGQTTQRPVQYKFLLLSSTSEFPISVAIHNPDSLRRFYAPAFAGWDSTGPDSTTVRLQNLTLNETYLFVVTAFDEFGDYDPVFSLNKNMLRFRVGLVKTLGPALTLFGEGYENTTAGHVNDPSRYARVSVAPDRPLTFNWFATPALGLEVTGHRWVLDPADINDERTRESPDDLHHWSPFGGATSVTLGPFPAGPKGTKHRLFVEAEDDQGNRTLGAVEFFVWPDRMERDLLIVDDTRLRPDHLDRNTGCVFRPFGMWPTAAELDTFLYARGGFPWRCYPPGTVTPPGIFNGYSFDTLGTRLGLADGTVPLATLMRYRHVIWIVDGWGATNYRPPSHPTEPMTSLRYMTAPGRTNSLAEYARIGGKAWVLGGGAGYASNIEWDDNTNNAPTTTFSIHGRNRELAPGRFMYDFSHWQSEFRFSEAPVTITRYTGRFGDSASFTRPGSRYANLPAKIRKKNDPPSEPLPPLRTSASQVFRVVFPVEYLQLDNRIVENLSADPDNPDERSTLDTLYRVTGQSLPRNPEDTAHNVLMTYYQGPGIPQGFVFTGFAPWEWRREDCQRLVDFVLQDLWGMVRTDPAGLEPVVRRDAAPAPRPPKGRGTGG